MRLVALVAVVIGVLVCGLLWTERVDEEPSTARAAWRIEQFLIVPVRVHLFRATNTVAVGTRLTEKDVERVFGKAAAIWHAAGIHLFVEFVVVEKPDNVGGIEADTMAPLDALAGLRPIETRSGGMFHVYYVGAMPVNGIYLRRDAVFVQEAARLREVPGGIDEPLPRVTAHELGHGLGLPHRQDRTNLMASGTTGTALNEQEIATARRTAESLEWVLPASTFLDRADSLVSSGHGEAAAARYRSLLMLPGESPLKRRASSALSTLKLSRTR